jgi:uncharacterized protein
MADLYVSWDEYHQTIEALAVQIHQSGWQFNQIVCLARGGLRVGDTLSRIFDQPLAILSATSYSGTSHDRSTLVFADDLTKTTQHLGSHILLVDDLVDSGVTLQKTLPWLDRKYGFYIEEVRTAVLWAKGCAGFQPDYAVQHLPENPWIHQPFERYEQISPGDLVKSE